MKKMLVRDFIYDRLYHPIEGYFVKNIQLGALKKPIEFKQLMGYEDYMNQLQENYPENQWLTPSEVFRPYYGITIGNYINQQFRFTRKEKLRIVEIGAGYGAACEGILYYLRNHQPYTFANMEYHLIDISPEACKQAEIRLQEEFKILFKKGNIKIFNTDFLNYKQNCQSNEMWFFLFLEVFDNLAHDKIINGQQVYVEDMKEYTEPINDQLIQETYQLYQEYRKQNPEQIENRFVINTMIKLIQKYYGKEKSNSIFLPTGAYQVLKHIKNNFINPSLIIGDFDMLKNNYTQSAINAPIVSKKLKQPHEKQDYESYLVQRGEADIFFPTDFLFIQYMIKKIMNLDSQIFKAYQFADQFSQSSWTTTKSGYNPLKEDFNNTSFLVIDHS